MFEPFNPSVNLNDEITWLNEDSDVHKLVSGRSFQPDKIFSTAFIPPGKSFSVQLTALNTFGKSEIDYFCYLHPGETGRLIIENRTFGREEKESVYGPLQGYSRKLGAKPEEEPKPSTEILSDDISSQAVSPDTTEKYMQMVVAELRNLRDFDLKQDTALEKITSILKLIGKSQNLNIAGFLDTHRQLAKLERHFNPEILHLIDYEGMTKIREKLLTIVFWDISSFSTFCEVLKGRTSLLHDFLKELSITIMLDL